MTVPTQPCRRERVLVERVDDETVLLDLDSGSYFALNDVGARIWELCDGDRSVDDIVSTITAEYDVDTETARRDVVELLSMLAEEQLLAPG